MTKAIDDDAFSTVNHPLFVKVFSFKTLQIEKNLSEARSLLDRCVDNRERAYRLQQEYFDTLNSYSKQRKDIDELEAECFRGEHAKARSCQQVLSELLTRRYKGGYDTVKHTFDFDLAGAYHRLLSVRKGAEQVYGITTDNHIAVPPFPIIERTTQNALDTLTGWTQLFVAALQQRRASDQEIIIRISIRNDCKKEDGATHFAWDYSIRNGQLHFTLPEGFFTGLDCIRLRGLSVCSNMHAWRMKIELPAIPGDSDPHMVYIGRVLPVGIDATGREGKEDQVFRNSALHNLNPMDGVWKAQIIGPSLDDNIVFDEDYETDFYLDLHLSAIVVKS